MEAINTADLSMSLNCCLNPYCNGRYSWSFIFSSYFLLTLVLILIVMEDTHGDMIAYLESKREA